MTILLTGGLGKTTSRLAKILTAENHKILIASRSGSAADYPAVKFDWEDRASWNAVFDSHKTKASPITAVYLVVLTEDDDVAYQITMDFVNLARQHGVKRFVFLSSSASDKIDPSWRSQVESTFQKSDYEWAVLRPSWFMQNFSESPFRLVKAEGIIRSATGDGKLPFVDCEDIAAVAAKALTSQQPLNRDVLVLGPELLSYDDVASILSEVLGTQVTHIRFTQDEYCKFMINLGLPEILAKRLSELDSAIEAGAEARLSDDVASIIGRPPRSFRQFAEEAKGQW